LSRQPIDFLFSPYRRKVLAVLFLHPDEKFHVRQLERQTCISAGSLHRELKAMALAGILRRETQGNQVLYQVEPACPIFEELTAIFRKTVGLASVLSAGLTELADRIDVAFVFGSMASGRQHAGSDIDICVLGDIELFDVVKALGSVRDNLRREVNPVVMSTSQFIGQLVAKDRFAERLIDDPKIFLIGSQSELRELVQNRAARDSRHRREAGH
jgi:predicted nucleotidyltransferase